jgi:cytochrome c oxidase subunit 2
MRFWLPQATTSAAEVDYLILALLLTSCAILALVFGLILLYMIKYRAGSDIDRGVLPEKTWRLETAWTVATLLIFFGLFVWGADLYVRLFQPPSDALKIYVIGKQWMWKIEHQGRQREINALHLRAPDPAGNDVRGRDSRLCHTSVSDQARRASGPLRNTVVRGQ